MTALPEGSPAGPDDVTEDASGPAAGEGLAGTILALVPRKLILALVAAAAAALAHIAGLDGGVIDALFRAATTEEYGPVYVPVDRAHRPELRLERADQDLIDAGGTDAR